MAVEDIVNVLTEWYVHGEESFEEDYGSEALIVMQDMAHLLETELASQLSDDALWAGFRSDPRAMAPGLSGALEALVEADPGLADRVDALVEEFHAALQPSESQPAVTGEQLTGPSSFVTRRQPPVEPEEMESLDHRTNAGGGTYLYGNVKGGEVTVGEAVEISPDTLEGRNQLEMLSLEVRELFAQLTNTLEAHPEMASGVRADLRDELEALEAELALGGEADEIRIVQHLRNIGRLDHGFLELVLMGLSHIGTEIRIILQEAIRKVRS